MSASSIGSSAALSSRVDSSSKSIVASCGSLPVSVLPGSTLIGRCTPLAAGAGGDLIENAAGQRRCTFVTRIGVPCWQVVKTPGCSTPVTRTGTPTGTSTPSTWYVAPPVISTLQPGSTPASTTPSRVTGRPVSLGPPGSVGRGAAGVEGVAGPGGLVGATV